MTSSRSAIPLLASLLLVLAACGSSAANSPATGALPSTATPSPLPTGAVDGALGAAASGEPMEQRDEGGGVTVKATWVGSTAGVAFEVALDTHSIDLDGFDLRDATLLNDSGVTMADPVWDADKGGHHRSGRLAFQGDPGPFLASTAWIELSVPDIAGVPVRTLRWALRG
jgi:hypothetical protein